MSHTTGSRDGDIIIGTELPGTVTYAEVPDNRDVALVYVNKKRGLVNKKTDKAAKIYEWAKRSIPGSPPRRPSRSVRRHPAGSLSGGCFWQWLCSRPFAMLRHRILPQMDGCDA